MHGHRKRSSIITDTLFITTGKNLSYQLINESRKQNQLDKWINKPLQPKMDYYLFLSPENTDKIFTRNKLTDSEPMNPVILAFLRLGERGTWKQLQTLGFF